MSLTKDIREPISRAVPESAPGPGAWVGPTNRGAGEPATGTRAGTPNCLADVQNPSTDAHGRGVATLRGFTDTLGSGG